MILNSFHGMGRPSFAVKSTNVNHVPGLYLFPPYPPGRGQGERYSYVLQSYRGITCRHFQGACGRRCAPVPNPMWGRGLSERSEFRSPNLRDRGKGPRRATPGRPWFWVLLPKQKDRVVRGRNPANPPPRRAGPQPRKPLSPPSSSTLVIEDPVSLSFAFSSLCHPRPDLGSNRASRQKPMTVVTHGDLTLSMTLRYHASAGWSSLVARWARFCGELIRWLLAKVSDPS